MGAHQAEGTVSKGLEARSKARRTSGHQLCALSLPSSEVTHVVMEQTPAEEASCWQEHRATAACPRECTRPALLDISWFTESMAAGQPVPVERRHRLEVSWVAWRRGSGECPSAGCGSEGTGDLSAALPCLQMSGQWSSSQTTRDPGRPGHPSFCSRRRYELLGSTYFEHLQAFLAQDGNS